MSVWNRITGTTLNFFGIGLKSTVGIGVDGSNNMTFKDEVVSGTKTLTDLLSATGITTAQHLILDQLVHDLDEDHYMEPTYSGWKITAITVWTNSGKATKIRDWAYTYTGIKVTTLVVRQYDGSGTLAETLTFTFVYSANKLSNVTCVRS